MASPVIDRRSRMIDGVPFLCWGISGESTFAGAFAAASSVTGNPVSYSQLLGVTGLAFLVRWYRGIESPWCPSSPCGEFPPYVEAARKAYGFEMREVWGEEAIRSAAPLVREEIDAGRPFLVYDDSCNMAVDVGYEDDGETLILHEYGSPSEPTLKPLATRPMFLLLLGSRGPTLSQRDTYRQGLVIGVHDWNARHDPADDDTSGYWMGGEAYRHWVHDLAHVDTLSDEERSQLFFVSWWNHDVISNMRLSAAPFLREASEWMPSYGAKHLLLAADLYDEASARLLAPRFDGTGFFGPMSEVHADGWTPEMRAVERAVLTEAEALEARAMEEVERALG